MITITYSWETSVSPAMRAAWERAAESWEAVDFVILIV
jgi:flavin-binding protein dodecin